MECRRNAVRIFMLALMLAATSISAVAQVVSRAGHVTIIAIMPEDLSLSIHSTPAHSASANSATEIPGVVTGITTAWSLMPGRAKITTLATVNQVHAPVIVAEMSSSGIGPFPDDRNAAPRGFAAPPNVSSIPMSSMSLTSANRRGESTVDLPDSTDPVQPRQLPANVPSGTLRIQVQPVL